MTSLLVWRMRKKIRIILILLILFYLGCFVFLIYSGLALQRRVAALPEAVMDQDWRKSAGLINDSADLLKNIKISLVLFFPFTKLPFVKSEVSNIYSILDSGLALTNIGEDFALWADGNEELSKIDIFSFPSLSAKDKETLLSSLDGAADVWQRHKD